MTQSNEAADRLRTAMRAYRRDPALVDEALAAERHATVERIRDRLDTVGGLFAVENRWIRKVLDEEAQR